MAAVTVLQIVQRACALNGIDVPNSLLGNTDKNVLQLVELLHQEASELSARTEWQVMTWPITFTSVAGEDQGSILTITDVIDMKWRTIVSDTMWDRTAKEPIIGPLTAQEYQAVKALPASSSYKNYRISLNRILITPNMEVGHTIAFEFTTQYWLLHPTGTGYKERITTDEDLPVLDTDLLQMGLEWRYLKKQGLSYAEEFQAYERRVIDAIARDGSKRVRSLTAGADLSGIQQAIPRVIGS